MKAKDFDGLLKSIDEARAIRAGKQKPSRVITFNPLEVKTIRKRLHVSQTQFANLIGVSAATLRNWEQGRTYPEGAARALLKIAAYRPDAVLESLRSCYFAISTRRSVWRLVRMADHGPRRPGCSEPT